MSEVKDPEAIRLRYGQRAVQGAAQAAELVKHRNTVERIGQPVHVPIVRLHDHILRYAYYTNQVVNLCALTIAPPHLIHEKFAHVFHLTGVCRMIM